MKSKGSREGSGGGRQRVFFQGVDDDVAVVVWGEVARRRRACIQRKGVGLWVVGIGVVVWAMQDV